MTTETGPWTCESCGTENGAYTAVSPSTDPVVIQRRADRAAERIDAVVGLIDAGEISGRGGGTVAEHTAYWIRHLGITYADITAAREERARTRAAIRALIDPSSPMNRIDAKDTP